MESEDQTAPIVRHMLAVQGAPDTETVPGVEDMHKFQDELGVVAQPQDTYVPGIPNALFVEGFSEIEEAMNVKFAPDDADENNI